MRTPATSAVTSSYATRCKYHNTTRPAGRLQNTAQGSWTGQCRTYHSCLCLAFSCKCHKGIQRR